MSTEKLAELRVELLRILVDSGVHPFAFNDLIAACKESLMVKQLEKNNGPAETADPGYGNTERKH